MKLLNVLNFLLSSTQHEGKNQSQHQAKTFILRLGEIAEKLLV